MTRSRTPRRATAEKGCPAHRAVPKSLQTVYCLYGGGPQPPPRCSRACTRLARQKSDPSPPSPRRETRSPKKPKHTPRGARQPPHHRRLPPFSAQIARLGGACVTRRASATSTSASASSPTRPVPPLHHDPDGGVTAAHAYSGCACLVRVAKFGKHVLPQRDLTRFAERARRRADAR